MRTILFAAVAAVALPAVAIAAADEDLPSVRVAQGNLIYLDASGQPHRLSHDGKASDAVLSPDGQVVAFIHQDKEGDGDGNGAATSLWIEHIASKTATAILRSAPSDTPERNLATFSNPIFSLDGGYVYINADAWTTSTAVHQVSMTGQERFVIDGAVKAVIRTGPKRGYLLVQRHEYRKAPEAGSFEPFYVVRPDGQDRMMVPGSDRDDSKDNVQRWLAANGWDAW